MKKEPVGKFGQRPNQIWPKAKFRPSLQRREGLVFIKMKSVPFVTSNLVPNTALECIANQFMRTNEDRILQFT